MNENCCRILDNSSVNMLTLNLQDFLNHHSALNIEFTEDCGFSENIVDIIIREAVRLLSPIYHWVKYSQRERF